jgi:hypothetical protein
MFEDNIEYIYIADDFYVYFARYSFVLFEVKKKKVATITM